VSWTLRRCGLEDADAIARLMHDSFRGYLTFATPGWEPPAVEDEAGWMRERLGHPDVWCQVAEAEGELVAHVAFMPATMAHAATDEPGLAHFWALFVRPSHWGTGLASELHRAAVREAAARGYSSMRLFAAAGQARARRFYEREGWAAAGEPVHDDDSGLPVVEYRRPL
jgi:GNAT superfamily N-acetyltransferase